MKVAPISADLLIKIGLGAVALGVVSFVVYKVTRAAGAAADVIGDAAQAINPANPENVAYHTANTIGGAVVSPNGPGRNADGSWTLGGWLYDINPFENHYKG